MKHANEPAVTARLETLALAAIFRLIDGLTEDEYPVRLDADDIEYCSGIGFDRASRLAVVVIVNGDEAKYRTVSTKEFPRGFISDKVLLLDGCAADEIMAGTTNIIDFYCGDVRTIDIDAMYDLGSVLK